MSRALTLVIASFCILLVSFQKPELFIVTNGSVALRSDAPLEIISAKSTTLQGFIRTTDNAFAFSLNNNSFQGFNSELQREHFNDNYMETEKYPKSTFTGKIIEPVDYSKDGTYEIRGKGKLMIHGVAQERIIKVNMQIKGKILTIESVFRVPLKDHDITIPKVVNQKIAEEIEMTVSATFQRK